MPRFSASKSFKGNTSFHTSPETGVGIPRIGKGAGHAPAPLSSYMFELMIATSSADHSVTVSLSFRKLPS